MPLTYLAGYDGSDPARGAVRLAKALGDSLDARVVAVHVHRSMTAIFEDAAEDVLAYMAFPAEHWRQIHSTNPLERLNKEIRRRTRVVGIFPSRASLLRLVSAVLAEQDDEWQAAERGYFSKGSMAKVSPNVKAPPRLMKEVATA